MMTARPSRTHHDGKAPLRRREPEEQDLDFCVVIPQSGECQTGGTSGKLPSKLQTAGQSSEVDVQTERQHPVGTVSSCSWGKARTERDADIGGGASHASHGTIYNPVESGSQAVKTGPENGSIGKLIQTTADA